MPTSHHRISASAYQALQEALPVIFWYKRSFNTYLRTALRGHHELLAGLDFELTKREVSDQLVERLAEREANYRDVTIRLMMEVAATTTFPELERHENRDALTAQARSAVESLRLQTQQHEKLIVEKQMQEADRAAYSQRAEARRRFSDEIDSLRDEFYAMSSNSENPNKRGLDFEKFLNRLFSLFDLEPRLAYNLETQQIDGSFHFDTDDYIVEVKWTRGKVDVRDTNYFASKVQSKGKNALGLFISVNGFSEPALKEHRRSTSFMTMDALDLLAILDQRASLDEVLRRKKRHANETGNCYFPVSELFG